jgi:hypothetical protein
MHSNRGRNRGLSTAAVLAYLGVVVPTYGYAPNPPFCASRVTNLIANLVDFAQEIVSAVADCTPPGLSRIDCAADIIGAISDLEDSAVNLAEMAFACANFETDCEIVSIETTEYFSSIANRLIAAAADCDSDVFVCTIDVVDLADDVVNTFSDIYAAVHTCNPEEEDEANEDSVENVTWDNLPIDTGLPYPVPLYAADGGSNILIVNKNSNGYSWHPAAKKSTAPPRSVLAVDDEGIVKIDNTLESENPSTHRRLDLSRGAFISYGSPNSWSHTSLEGIGLDAYFRSELEGYE